MCVGYSKIYRLCLRISSSLYKKPPQNLAAFILLYGFFLRGWGCWGGMRCWCLCCRCEANVTFGWYCREVIFMEPTPLCLLQNNLHIFIQTHHRFILVQIVLLHVCYMFWPVFGHHQACRYRNLIKEDIVKSRGIMKLFLIHSCGVCVNKNTVHYRKFGGTLHVH
jgi:hypothetical protein